MQHINLFIPQRKLKSNPKRRQQKYLILLSNQMVIIDTEFVAMKRARAFDKPIIEMLAHNGRSHSAQPINLTSLLESLEQTK